MTHRERLPTARPDCTISLVTEPRRDGRWAVVATVEQRHDDAIEVHPVPLPEGPGASFATEHEARSFAVAEAERWIAHNTSGAPAAGQGRRP
jgi:hypothetical protein